MKKRGVTWSPVLRDRHGVGDISRPQAALEQVEELRGDLVVAGSHVLLALVPDEVHGLVEVLLDGVDDRLGSLAACDTG